MSKHTPGPWEVKSEETLSIRDRQDSMIALTGHLIGRHGVGGRRGGSEVSANARLIAAAPDMLFALEQMAHWIEQDGDPHLIDSDENPGQFVRDAIAKAKGGDE